MYGGQSLCHTLFQVLGIQQSTRLEKAILHWLTFGGREEKNNTNKVISWRGKWRHADRLEWDST